MVVPPGHPVSPSKEAIAATEAADDPFYASKNFLNVGGVEQDLIYWSLQNNNPTGLKLFDSDDGTKHIDFSDDKSKETFQQFIETRLQTARYNDGTYTPPGLVAGTLASLARYTPEIEAEVSGASTLLLTGSPKQALDSTIDEITKRLQAENDDRKYTAALQEMDMGYADNRIAYKNDVEAPRENSPAYRQAIIEAEKAVRGDDFNPPPNLPGQFTARLDNLKINTQLAKDTRVLVTQELAAIGDAPPSEDKVNQRMAHLFLPDPARAADLSNAAQIHAAQEERTQIITGDIAHTRQMVADAPLDTDTKTRLMNAKRADVGFISQFSDWKRQLKDSQPGFDRKVALAAQYVTAFNDKADPYLKSVQAMAAATGNDTTAAETVADASKKIQDDRDQMMAYISNPKLDDAAIKNLSATLTSSYTDEQTSLNNAKAVELAKLRSQAEKVATLENQPDPAQTAKYVAEEAMYHYNSATAPTEIAAQTQELTDRGVALTTYKDQLGKLYDAKQKASRDINNSGIEITSTQSISRDAFINGLMAQAHDQSSDELHNAINGAQTRIAKIDQEDKDFVQAKATTGHDKLATLAQQFNDEITGIKGIVTGQILADMGKTTQEASPEVALAAAPNSTGNAVAKSASSKLT